VAAIADPTYRPGTPQPVNRLPNSDWLGVAAEQGLPALFLLWGAAVILLGWGVKRLREKPEREAALTTGALLCLFAAAGVMGSFDAVLLRPEPAFLVAICTGAFVPVGRGHEIRVPRSLRLAGAMALLLAASVLSERVVQAIRASQLIAKQISKLVERVPLLEAAEQADPGDYRVQAMLAAWYLRLDNCTSACRHASRALALYPEHEQAQGILFSCSTQAATGSCLGGRKKPLFPVAQDAAARSGVPLAIVLAVLQSEGLFILHGAEGAQPCWLELKPWRDSQMPAKAAELLNIPVVQVVRDPATRIRGLAALLARAAVETKLPSDVSLAAWHTPLRQFHGSTDPGATEHYANQVLRLAAGHSEALELALKANCPSRPAVLEDLATVPP
jgi:hypothetical protein